MEQAKSLWRIEYRGDRLLNEANLGTLLTIGNGEIGLRGVAPEMNGRRGTFLAGFFDGLPRPEMNPADFNLFLRSWSHMELVEGYHLESALVNCPDPLDSRLEADGEPLELDAARGDEIVRTLDMETGEVCFQLPVRTPSGKRATLTRRRIAAMDAPQLLYERCTLSSVDFSGEVRLVPQYREALNCNISGIYTDLGEHARRDELRLYDVLLNERHGDVRYLRLRGRTQGKIAAFLSRADEAPKRVQKGETVAFERQVAFACDVLHEPSEAALKALLAGAGDYERALEANRASWAKLWQDCDVTIEGDDASQRGIRHGLYQLVIAAPRFTDRVSVAAKGLTGEGYRGMVFWDTDIHMTPFYQHALPQAARNIARFRCNTLDGAREKAHRYGFVGASYPWETGVSGQEECESFLKLITNQLHITADVVYAIHQTELCQGEAAVPLAGEVYIETARFWLSKGRMTKDGLEIPLASGPDELHLDCDNNAYVLYMAALNLRLAKRAIERLRASGEDKWRALRERIGMTEDEAQAMLAFDGRVCCSRDENGVLEQCKGFFDLEDRIVYEDDPNIIPEDTQTVKQADVLMLLYLLPELVSRDELLANWNYYEPRTTHTSSLSFGVHGIIAAKLGLEEKAAYYLGRSLGIDLNGVGDSCDDGAHLAANGMSWSAIVSGIAGADWQGDTLRVHPRLPKGWNAVSFRLQQGGRALRLRVERDSVTVAYERGDAPLRVLTPSGERTLRAGETLCL